MLTHRTFLVKPRTFYVNAHGDDRADGRSPARAWRTLARVSSNRMYPGDRVFLAAGERFAGPLRLDAKDGGDATEPVVVGSYGLGRATIDGNAGATEGAISVHNTAGVVIRDLVLVGGPTDSADGISLYNDLPEQRRLSGVTVERVDVSHFRNGIGIGPGPGSLGFADVLVHDSAVHDNLLAGIASYGPAFDPAAPTYANENITVSGVDAYRNVGDPDAVVNSGSGIVLGSVSVGVVERTTAHDNGALSHYVEGPIGIWAYDSTRILIESSLSYRNRTSRSDGGGFGLDRNVSDSLVQYNLSYDNDGAGYLIFGDAKNRAHSRNVVRFNISTKDSRRVAYHGGVSVIGGLLGPTEPGGVFDLQIYQNTFVTMADADGFSPPAVMISDAMTGVVLRNNILVSVDGGPLVQAYNTTDSGASFEGNNYYTPGGGVIANWSGSIFADLAAWRSATRQETVSGSPTGLALDPGLPSVDPPTAVRDAGDLTAAIGFQLRRGSPMIGAGRADAGFDPGPRDFFDVALSGPRVDVGASHYAGAP